MCAKPGDEISEGYSEENYCVRFCGERYVEKNDEIMTIVEIEGTSKTTKNVNKLKLHRFSVVRRV